MAKTVRIDDDVYEKMVAEAQAAGAKTTRYINDKLDGTSTPAGPKRRPVPRTTSGKRYLSPDDCNHPDHLVTENHCGVCGSYVKK